MSKAFATLLLIGVFSPVSAFAMTGGVLATKEYAWSNQIGYIDFRNITITDSTVSGYAWATNSGFINFAPADFGGVVNDGHGNLSGSAWGEQLGWIDFDGVVIGSDGIFTGTATGTLVGTINFDCPNFCNTTTDWQSTATSPRRGGLIPATSNPPPTETPTPIPVPTQPAPAPVVVINAPLTTQPQQAGTLTVNTPTGPVVLTIPTNEFIDVTTYTITPEPLSSINQPLVVGDTVLMNGSFYNVLATDASGNPAESLSTPLTITLPLDLNTQALSNLGVYEFNPTNQEWTLIPDAVFTNTSVAFNISQFGKFAIFGGLPSTSKPPYIPLIGVTPPAISPYSTVPTKPSVLVPTSPPPIVPLSPTSVQAQAAAADTAVRTAVTIVTTVLSVTLILGLMKFTGLFQSILSRLPWRWLRRK